MSKVRISPTKTWTNNQRALGHPSRRIFLPPRPNEGSCRDVHPLFRWPWIGFPTANCPLLSCSHGSLLESNSYKSCTFIPITGKETSTKLANLTNWKLITVALLQLSLKGHLKKQLACVLFIYRRSRLLSPETSTRRKDCKQKLKQVSNI